MELIDTHCHLYASEFDNDRDEMLQRAMDAGISRFLLPNIDTSSIEVIYALADKYPQHCYLMMGLHPCSVNAAWQKEMDRVRKELGSGRKFIAIGEIGLDYYWDTSYKEEQLTVFRQQLKLAKELNLPVAIHTRNSFEDALKIVQEEQDGSLQGVFHCFTGTVEEGNSIVDVGFYMGIGGVATFKNGGMDKVLPHLPLDRMILETDAPYLAPVPFRGKRNESAYIARIAERLAELKGLPVEEIARQTTGNANTLFHL